MDRQTAEHFYAWLERAVHESEQHTVEQQIHALLQDHPDLIERTDAEVWTPSTHHAVPQPAGHQCADWYERVHPGACEILYALAHVKGESDRLKALCEELRGMLELCILQLSMSVSAFAGQDLTRHDILRDEGREVLVIARAALKKTEKP